MSAASRRQVLKDETRKMIKETAFSLFEKNGYENTTMRTLAKEAGVGLGTIFLHFPSKLALLAEAFLDDLNEIVEDGFVSLPEKALIQQLEQIVRLIFEFYARRPNLSRTMISKLLFLEGSYGSDLENQLSEFISQIEVLFKKAMYNNEICAKDDPVIYVHAFSSFYLYCLHAGLKDSVFDIDSQVRMFSQLMTNFLSIQNHSNEK